MFPDANFAFGNVSEVPCFLFFSFGRIALSVSTVLGSTVLTTTMLKLSEVHMYPGLKIFF